MDLQAKLYRSLPPLVEGKVHGNLKLVINEILWTRKNPGGVIVVASWWGEQDSAQFRPIDATTNTIRLNEDVSEIYVIKTNARLFEDYIKNCATIELVIIVEKTHEIIGTAHIDELFKILECKPYLRYVPILNNKGSKIGEIHVSLQLKYLTKLQNMQLKVYNYNKEKVHDDILLSAVDNLQYNGQALIVSCSNVNDIKKKNAIKPINSGTCDVYKSALKTKRAEFQESMKRFNEAMTDKIVAQIVARAQRLRRAILKETYNEDPLALSDSSMSNKLYFYTAAEDEAKLPEYILGKEMTCSEEREALDTLRLTSPTSSLVDLAFKTTYEDNNMNSKMDEDFPVKSSYLGEDVLHHCEPTFTELKETDPLDYVDSIRIFIESFILSPAGYRRAKSTCLQHGVPLSLAYYVQYDTIFESTKQTNMKDSKETKFARTCAEKQMAQVVDFNYEGIYGISGCLASADFPLKFKIFVRHLNQKLSTELGHGSININDIINTINLSSIQSIIIINKGIKIGELKVTVELGCDNIGFGQKFIDAVISTKENVPVLNYGVKSVINTNGNKYKNVTGNHSSKSNKMSSVSTKRIDCLTDTSNKDLITTEDTAGHRERDLDNKKIETNNPEFSTKNKILLHGLIYIAEGKDLPESNTYLICRAFWREDKTTSQICSNTKNPFYHFCQLVPLIHGTELLERIRDNYIIIEVYSQQNSGTDNLLGITKLPVHQLYVAYRDPLILPHLLLSKYPIISVDGWVSINDPISGKSNGKLLALVALGTAEQIAFLEMSRGLRNINIMPQTICNYRDIPNNTNYVSKPWESIQCNIPEASTNSTQSVHNNFTPYTYDTSDRDLTFANCKTGESQTDITSVKSKELDETIQKAASSGFLHSLNDDLTNELNVKKTSTDQIVQTETIEVDKAEINRKDLCLNTINSYSLFEDSDSSSPRNNFQLPIEMYRSVGVGAEYDELHQQNNTYNTVCNSSMAEKISEKESTDSNNDFNSSFFRVIVEIECALHLPKIERMNDSIEPSTYVTFQDLVQKADLASQLNPYMITNVFPHSCDPKWNWRCNTKLSTELFLNNEKRLIFKIWHLADPDTSTIINLEKDIVIGFSAVDLSVLMTGFPTVSGWFHIMDFTGRCNGQIKINITPLDNLSSFGKNALPTLTNISVCNLPRLNWLYSHQVPSENMEVENMQQTSPYNEKKCLHNITQSDDCTENNGQNLEDVSMSFLSSSLKQKLTELDEITKRLQLRLHNVTNTAFEDEFENDLDMIEPNNDNESTDNRNFEITSSTSTMHSPDEKLQIPKEQCQRQNDSNAVQDEKHISSVVSDNCNQCLELTSNQSKASEVIDTGYCLNSNTYFTQNSGYYYNQYQNQYGSTTNQSSDNITECPVRGTKTHINHLLDKLSLQLPSNSISGVSMKKDIIELLSDLRGIKNNLQDKNDSDCNVNTCSVPTQTDSVSIQHTYSHTKNLGTSDASVVEIQDAPKLSEKSQHHNRISTVIREELVTEENNDILNFDDLTTYLMISNVRHMDLNNIFNPLLYQHIVPDLQITSTVSPEEAAEQLDDRYAKNFNTIMSDSLSRIDHSTEKNMLPQVDIQIKNQTNVLESRENTELSRLTTSNILKNVNDNTNTTVTHKSSNNDLTSDSTESTTIISSEKSSIQQDIEMKNYCSGSPVSGVSRQAPDGGNPIEEINTSTVTKRQDNVQNVSKHPELPDT